MLTLKNHINLYIDIFTFDQRMELIKILSFFYLHKKDLEQWPSDTSLIFQSSINKMIINLKWDEKYCILKWINLHIITICLQVVLFYVEMLENLSAYFISPNDLT